MKVKFGSLGAHPDLDGEVLGSSQGHTNDFRNYVYCSSACADHNEREKGECLRHKKAPLIS